jgi:hypothetical protein
MRRLLPGAEETSTAPIKMRSSERISVVETNELSRRDRDPHRDVRKGCYEQGFQTVCSFYEERARLLLPGAPMVEGRPAIQSAQQGMIEGGVQALSLDVVDVIEAGRSWRGAPEQANASTRQRRRSPRPVPTGARR